MKKKRICIITKFLEGVHTSSGGMEVHVNDLINGIKKTKRFKITIITSKHPKGKKEEFRQGIKIYYINSTIGRNPLSRYKFFKNVSKKLKKINYENLFDIIHIQSDFGMGYFWHLKKKIPIVTTIHGTTLNEFKGSIEAKPYLIPIWIILFPFYYLTERNMLKNSDRIICVSDVVKNSLLNQYKFLKNKKIKKILNGIDLTKFKKIDSEKIKSLRQRFAKRDEFLIISIGNIIKQKGYHLIIKAFPEIIKRNNKIKLVIVGGGDYLKNLKKLVLKKKMDQNIFFAGRVQHKEVINYYNIANCFVFPTLRGEGLPYVIIEAMACGNVIITTKNGGTDLVNKENGIILNAKNEFEIVNSILKLSMDKIYCKNLLIKSKKDVKKKCNLTDMIKENLKIYGEVI